MKHSLGKKALSLLLTLMLCVSSIIGAGVLNAGAASVTVYLRGTFNDWEAQSGYIMTEDNNNHLLITVHLSAGTYQYKAGDKDWSACVIPGGDNATVTLAQEGDVTFVANKNDNTIQAYIHSSLSPESSAERVVLRSQWAEHSDQVLTLSGDRVSYASEKNSYSDSSYWNLIYAEGDYFYIQNDSTKGYMYLNATEVYCSPQGNTSDYGLWRVDTSTGNKRFINKANQNAVINTENQNGYVQASQKPIYYTSSQWAFEYTHYEYTLTGNSVIDTGYSAYANSPTSITSYASGTAKTWNLEKDLSGQPAFSAPNSTLAQAVYNLTLEEAIKSIHTDSFGQVFYTGTAWQKVWTRDTAMSNLYSLAWIFPEISYNCEREKIKTSGGVSVFEQDTGTGGSYPVSTDKIITMLSVWETYLADGNTEHLSYFYDVCLNTVMQDMEVAYDADAGLFRGETSGIDWRDQTYPDWTSETYDSGLNNIAQGKSASVNAIYCRVLEIMGKAAEVLGKGQDAVQAWSKMASDLEAKVSSRLWNEDLGLYSAWEYPEYMGSVQAEKADVLGNGFALWFNVGTDSQMSSICENYPLVTYGAPTVYPQKQGKLANANKIYHNFGVWPGWQSALMVGANYAGNEDVAQEIFNSNLRGAATSLTQKEVINYQTGEGVESDQQLWSIAGTLAGYYRVLFGMNYDEDGISFDPCIPDWMEGPFTLTNYKYRDCTLNITLSGEGDRLVSFTVDGRPVDGGYVFPADSQGVHNIEMILASSDARDTINKGDKNLVVCPDMPVTAYSSSTGRLSWGSRPGLSYKLWDGSKYIDVTGRSYYDVDTTVYGCYSLMAISEDGVCSELSKPIVVSPGRIKVEAESGSVASSAYIKRTTPGYSGTGYVQDKRNAGANLEITVTVPTEGRYLMSGVYNNPGDATSGISCAVRSVYVDGEDVGTLCFPEVYDNHNYQLSTHLSLQLAAGTHTVKVFYDSANWYDRNMSITKNDVEYDYFNFDYVPEKADKPIETQPDTAPSQATEPASTVATAPSYLLGDADKNGSVDVSDATYIQKYLADFEGYACDASLCDTDKDGRISIKDAAVIQKYLAGIITEL